MAKIIKIFMLFVPNKIIKTFKYLVCTIEHVLKAQKSQTLY